jgi:hypothetical protein
LPLQVDGLLSKVDDPLVEGVDIGGRSESGLAPGFLAKSLRQTFFQVLNAGVESDGAFVGGERVSLKRGSGDRWASAVAHGRFGLERVDLLQQVAVSIEECAVDPGGPSDPGRTDLGAFGDGLVKSSDDKLAAAWWPSSIGCLRVAEVAALRVFTRWPPQRSK